MPRHGDWLLLLSAQSALDLKNEIFLSTKTDQECSHSCVNANASGVSRAGHKRCYELQKT